MPNESKTWQNESAPRYTSYPTAPHFHKEIGPSAVAGWLKDIRPDEPLSLYLHVPFCDRLCWFCACHTKQTLKYEPVVKFLNAMGQEIRTVGAAIAGSGHVSALHMGGGSPTLLSPQDMRALMQSLRSAFSFRKDTSISVEIDPNDMTDGKLDALAEIGLTRASLGIQDFDIKVQRAINREQSFEMTSAVVEGLRRRGVSSVNLDILYGLPHQTSESVANTVDMTLSMQPNRIALFGYAHVPWFKKHQTMIDETVLPQAEERLEQSLVAADAIKRAGYVAIGLDHFARPGDSLAHAAETGKLRRNFQGYTDDNCETLIGLGPSSISRYRQGYAQNITATSVYEQIVSAGKLAIIKGIALTPEDKMRAWVIERLMCEFSFSTVALTQLFGPLAQSVLYEASLIAQSGNGASLALKGDRFIVPHEGRPFVRLIAAKFDSYLKQGNARHSRAV